MVAVEIVKRFERKLGKVKDSSIRERIKKQMMRVIAFPETGKPMRFSRKGTRELHIPPFRLAYAYRKRTIIFLDLYHKNKQ